MSLDVTADVASLNSLSFAGMVDIKNQHVMPQKEHVRQLPHANKDSSEFEFWNADPKKGFPADNSNGQLLEQANALPSNQSQTAMHTCSKSVVWKDQINSGRLVRTASSRERCTRVKIAADKKRTSSGFGQKFFKSFACRDCRVFEPVASIKAQASE